MEQTAKKVLGERSGVVFWQFIISVGCLAACVLMSVLYGKAVIDLGDAALTAIFFAADVYIVLLTVYYFIPLIRIPEVLIEYNGSEIIFHPTKNKSITVLPQDITEFSLKRSWAGGLIVYLTGVGHFSVKTATDSFKVKYVRQAESVRSVIEELRKR